MDLLRCSMATIDVSIGDVAVDMLVRDTANTLVQVLDLAPEYLFKFKCFIMQFPKTLPIKFSLKHSFRKPLSGWIFFQTFWKPYANITYK